MATRPTASSSGRRSTISGSARTSTTEAGGSDRSLAPAGPPVVVLLAHDVVFAEIGAVLDLDDDDGHAPHVLGAMPGAPRHRDRLARAEPPAAAADGDLGSARHDHPVLGAAAMPLEAEAMAGLHHEPLHLVARSFLERLEAPPGPRLERRRPSRPGAGRAPSAHGSSRIKRVKSASTALATSSRTSGLPGSRRRSTTMAPPRRVRRPTCMEAMFTLWRPRMEPIFPTMPGRSSYESTRICPSGMNSMWRSRRRTMRGVPSKTVPAMILRPAPACVVTVMRLV